MAFDCDDEQKVCDFKSVSSFAWVVWLGVGCRYCVRIGIVCPAYSDTQDIGVTQDKGDAEELSQSLHRLSVCLLRTDKSLYQPDRLAHLSIR